MGPKLMNCCKPEPEQMGTKDFGKMVKRIQTLEEGRVPAKEARRFNCQVGEGENNEGKRRAA